MGVLEDRDFSHLPTIPEFYKGKTILITGGSGFLGKVLIEKLLYSCTDLDRIYLILRSKKGVSPEARLDQIYAFECFDRLKAGKPNVFKEKVFVISGDVMELGLGLSERDRDILISRVNIVFHVAASVRFDDPLAYSVKLNLRGTRELVALCREMRDLLALVHVSTSYSNTNHDPVEEVMYPPHADWRDTIQVCETVDDHTLRVLTPKYLGELPNTYTFSKQLAEHLVYEHRGKLPAVIIRPSIVISSVNEPMVGWIDNFNGPVSLLIASAKGIMRSMHSDPNLTADYIAVDVTIRSMITAGWEQGTKKLQSTDDIPIYNCCAGKLNNITAGEIIELGREIVKIAPLNDSLWHAGGSLTTSATLHYMKVLVFHLLPALFVDSILWIIGRKPMLVKIQRRIYIANLALRYYILKQWTFCNDNFISLRSSIKEQDREQFYYDIEGVDKIEYFKNCCIGGRKYLLKEKQVNAEEAKRHYMRMYVLDRIVRCLFYGFIAYWLINTNYAKNTITKCCNMIYS